MILPSCNLASSVPCLSKTGFGYASPVLYWVSFPCFTRKRTHILAGCFPLPPVRFPCLCRLSCHRGALPCLSTGRHISSGYTTFPIYSTVVLFKIKNIFIYIGIALGSYVYISAYFYASSFFQSLGTSVRMCFLSLLGA